MLLEYEYHSLLQFELVIEPPYGFPWSLFDSEL